MYKHHFIPYYYSFSNGDGCITTFKCKFCGKVLESQKKQIDELSRSEARCMENHISIPTFKEVLYNKYNCLEVKVSLRYKIEKYIEKKYIVFKKIISQKVKKIKLRKTILWLYIMSLKIK